MHRELVIRAMAGEHEAFSELVRLALGKLYVTARLILRDSELAEDAVQEALIVAWRDLSALRDPDRFEAWLRSLLVRACYRVPLSETAEALGLPVGTVKTRLYRTTTQMRALLDAEARLPLTRGEAI